MLLDRVVIKRNTVTRTHIRRWRTRAPARAEARLNASVCICACALVRARVRERVAMSSRTKRVDVCEECKVRGRRGSKRANRALRHSRRKEVMCNNARPAHALRSLPDNNCKGVWSISRGLPKNTTIRRTSANDQFVGHLCNSSCIFSTGDFRVRMSLFEILDLGENRCFWNSL